MRERRSQESGQVAALVIGFFLVIVLLVVVVVDASAAYLRRQRLDSLADGAALAAADSLAGERLYREGLGDRASLDPQLARAQVADYLAAVGASRDFPGLRYSVHASAETVEVTVSTPLELPFAPPGWVDHTEISGHAAAVVQVG